MAVDSKFFNIPFATSGDKAAIPEAVQPSGAISFTQGFGPDYERDPATDPLAKRVPRDETNEYLYQITNSIKYIQWFGLPQWTAVADGGPANYPITARVRYDAGAGMQAWVSLVATNTAIPGSDATKWAVDEAFSVAALEATFAEALAGAIGTKIITPRRMSSAVQRAAWTYSAAGGTAAAVTVTLSPAPAALQAGMEVVFKVANASTGATTLNVNGLGAVALQLPDGSATQLNDLAVNDVVAARYDGAAWRLTAWPIAAINRVAQSVRSNVFTDVTPGTRNFTVPAGITKLYVELWGASAGSFASASGQSSGGAAGGGYSAKTVTVTPGQVISYTVGAPGSQGTAGAVPGNGGNTSWSTPAFQANGSTRNPLATIASPAFGGVGGTASGGDINIEGQAGSAPVNNALGSAGGGSFGYFGFPGPVSQVGVPGVGPGTGGSGAGTQLGTTIFLGAVGREGQVRITY